MAKESTSHSHIPTEHNNLHPFSGKLIVDEKLKLSHVHFKQKINDFFNGKDLNPLTQLTKTSAFPTLHVLAKFASKAYVEYKTGENDDQYETRLALPDAWKLLTTASNGNKANGYFGAAYWHPEHQQVLIAHRGTKFKNLGAIFTDVVGVMFKQHVPQMSSASTFAHKVVEVLREVNQEKGTSFQVFFTGHSLGGWLAQITTFTTKYLKIEGNTFLRSDNVPLSYHPHTVVFDSPGCKDMLSQMTDKLDVLYEGRFIDLEQLDITSYLSAPNRINTCRKHLGTVYRIFPDLSHMGWWEKHTALYNKATHGMPKIVEFFDPEKVQTHDEQGNLKLQVVVDWPVTAGLSPGKKYKSLFKWANHLNDYHPEGTEVTFQIKGYTPMRYQTKSYDERVCKLSVFCQQERQFLESYRLLRQLPEFFQPKELFSVVRDEQTQGQAKKLLQYFEVENDTIRCTNANELQALIPYVKRLLALYPQLGENTKGVLTQQQIGNNVYQFVTKRYVEILRQNPLEISKPDDLNLRDFLNSEEHKVLQLRMVDGDAWTGLIKVYKMLEKAPTMKDLLNEGHYTILTLEHLVHVNQLVNLNTLLQSSTAPHLLMMSSETSHLLNVETKQILKSLFNTLRQKQSVKFILTTLSEVDIVNFLQDIAKETLTDGFVTRDERLTWGDLTHSSQEKLLENVVNIQGSEIALNQLISAEWPLPNSLPLAELLEKRYLKIGEGPVSHCNFSYYDERYYIDRKFTHQVIIKHDISNDKKVRSFKDFIATSEQQFRQLCQLNPKNNVHWLEKGISGNFVWQQSQGSLETLRKYIDTENSPTYTAADLVTVLEQAQQQRVILISDTAGMGKSTVLTNLSKQIKENFSAKWVVKIELNDHTNALKELKTGRIQQIDEKKAVEFISERLLRLKPGLEMELFKKCCEQKKKVEIIIMMDGFDEICPFYKDTVINLLQALRQTAVEQLWVTTRPHLRNELEDKLQQLSYTLESFSDENQVEFFTKFWSLKDWIIEMDSKEKEDKKIKLAIYAKELIKKLSQSISDEDKHFTGVPLQCRMLAEAFDKEVKTFCQSNEFVPEFAFKIDLLGLYEIFLNRKYDICAEEKFKFSMTNVGAELARKQWVETNVQSHQILALKLLFDEELVAPIHIKRQCSSSDEDLTRTGLVQVSNEGKLHFIHLTFGEFYVADYFAKELINESNISQEIQDLLLEKIFLLEEYRVIRAFIDGLLSRSGASNEVLKQCGNRIHDLGEKGVVILHTAACENNANVIGFLLDCVLVAGHKDALVEKLLAQDDKRQTAWHVAANNGKLEALEKIWEYAKEVLSTDEINNKFLLAKHGNEVTALHQASYSGNLPILEGIWKMAKEKMPKEELKKLMLAQDYWRKTACKLAANVGKVEILDKLWEWAKELLNTDELNNNLLLAKDLDEGNVLHHATYSGNVQTLESVWMLAKEQMTPEELNKFMLDKDFTRKTAWHKAAKRGKLEILDILWEWAKEVLNTEDLNQNLLLAKDWDEETVLHHALYSGNVQILDRIWKLAKEQLTPEELNKLLVAKYDERKTVWHVAAQRGKVEILDKLWEWAKGLLNKDELNNKLLLAKDMVQKTVLHLSICSSNEQILGIVWELAKEQLTPEELNKLFLAQDCTSKTVWHAAAKRGQVEILDNLWELAKQLLNTDELNNNLFLAKDWNEETILYYASYSGNVQILERIWKLAKEQLTPEELNKLLLAKNDKGRTAWHVAAKRGKVETLDKLWELAIEILNTDELNNNLLLAKDCNEDTVLHYASYSGNVQILETIWKLAKKQLTPEDLNNLLLAQNDERKTAWQMAEEWGEVEILDKLGEWAKEVPNTDELNNNLLPKDWNEETVFNHAT